MIELWSHEESLEDGEGVFTFEEEDV
jgi:hypothetical protein